MTITGRASRILSKVSALNSAKRKLDEAIEVEKGKLEALQRKCPHPNLISERHSIYQDSWVELTCPDCHMRKTK